MADALHNLAAGLLEPARAAEVVRHHRALVEAMNGSVDSKGEQDALAVFEAVARLLGQMIGSMPNDDRRGLLSYVALRALHYADVANSEGVSARMILEPDDMGQGGHA